MNPEFTRRSFANKYPPAWPCPTCSHGVLGLVSDVAINPNASTRQNEHEDWWDYDYCGYVFHGLLECNACGEHVSITGTGEISQEYTEDGHGWEYVTLLTPTYFCPPLKLIDPKVSDGASFEIAQLLRKAHEVCWADPDSALNRLRSIVEEILDLKGVSRTTENGGFLPLHRRIELFNDPAFVQVQKALLAVKYVGNDSSHGFSGASWKDLLDIFSIVRYCLEKIFPAPDDDGLILATVTRINENKGLKSRPTQPIISPV